MRNLFDRVVSGRVTSGRVIFVCMLLVHLPRVTTGEVIQISFDGTVTEVPLMLADDFSIGDSLSGNYTIDTAQAIGDNWIQSVIELDVDISGNHYDKGTINGDIEVGGGLSDYILASLVDGPLANEFSPSLFSIEMDLNGLPDPLTPIPPTIDEVNSAGWSLVFSPDVMQVRGTVDRISVVPEPAAATSLLLGILLLGFTHRCSRR